MILDRRHFILPASNIRFSRHQRCHTPSRREHQPPSLEPLLRRRRCKHIRQIRPPSSLAQCHNPNAHLPHNLHNNGRPLCTDEHPRGRHHRRANALPLLRSLRLRLHAPIHRLPSRDSPLPTPRQGFGYYADDRFIGLFLQPICQSRCVRCAAVEILLHLYGVPGRCTGSGVLLLP